MGTKCTEFVGNPFWGNVAGKEGSLDMGPGVPEAMVFSVIGCNEREF